MFMTSPVVADVGNDDPKQNWSVRDDMTVVVVDLEASPAIFDVEAGWAH
jgi:hypothetical protein